MIDLIPNLKTDDGPLYIQLYNYIKKEIINGRIHENEKLPSIRQLSKGLEISRTTVENTFNQLLVEGYIFSLPKKGYYVSNIDTEYVHFNSDTLKINNPLPKEQQFLYDLRNDYVQEDLFDFNSWRKVLNHILNYNYKTLLKSGDLQGEYVLRKEIVKYVYQARGVVADVDQVIVGAGVQPLLNVLVYLLKSLGVNSCAIEDPGFNRAKNIFLHNEMMIIPIPVTHQGLDIDCLNETSADLCYVSPSHQFPMGTVMPVSHRIKLLKWARDNLCYIIEDDYNSELRYIGKPIPSMQSFDKKGRVIYFGSFSTLLLPSIRISYMILPHSLIHVYQKNKQKYPQSASKIEQLALSRFMEEGMFEKHIRKLKKNYAKKNGILIKQLKKVMGDKIKIGGRESGLKIVMHIDTTLTEEEIVKRCKKNGILLASLSEYKIVKRSHNKPVVILSYRGLPINKIEKAVDLLYKSISI